MILKSRWIEDSAVDPLTAMVVEEGKFEDGEPNGWVRIQYVTSKYGKSIKISDYPKLPKSIRNNLEKELEL